MSQKKANATKSKQSSKNNYIEPKNYLYALLILVGGILIALYIFKWYQVKNEEKLMTSYLIETKTIESEMDDLDDLNEVRKEAPSSYFIYLGYREDEDVYNLEKDLKRIIDKYKINDIFYYVDLTKLKKENSNYLNEIKNKLELKKLDNIPVIIYVDEGKILESNILDGVDGTMLKSSDLEQLLDVYDFEKIK